MHGLSVRRPSTIISVLLALAMAAAVTLGITPSTETASAALDSNLAPADATLLGSYIRPSGWNQTAVKNSVTKRENQLGRKYDIIQWFYPWGDAFPTWKEKWDVQNGRIPLIAWGDVGTSAVNRGQYDGYIRARADAVKALGAPVFIRWFSEMDTNYHHEKAVSPSSYISAWRRIHRIFANRGANNVVWVWCGTAAGFQYNRAQPYYPGADYVDWICADGYNWAPRKQGTEWTSFRTLFQHFYSWGSSQGKPLMIAETGTEEDTTPGRKAQWIRDAANTMKTTYTNIKAFVYFDARAQDFFNTYYDWRIDTSSTSLQAFKAMGLDPHFRWTRSHRPDALVKGPKGDFKGEDVYGDEGSQTVRTRLGRRRTVLTVRIENDGNISDTYRIHQEDAGKRLRVRYFFGGKKVTEEVRNGGFLTSPVDPGQAVELRVVVKAPKKGRAGKRVRIGVTSGSNKNVHDVVGAKLRRKRHRR
ncbi:MAG: glycoside hydrolase family 26 protein [Actinomycetota bacterium]